MSIAASVTKTVHTGSLSWMIDEVRQSLRLASTSLKDFANDPTNNALLLTAKKVLHQSHGALEIVDLEGLTLITGHAEKLIERFSEQPQTCTPALAQKIEQAFNALLNYIDELLSGAPHQPIKLFPQYAELLSALDAERIHPADLFFPDTSIRYTPQKTNEDDNQETLVPVDIHTLAAERTKFERGLLKLLRHTDTQAGIVEMTSAVHTLRQNQTESFGYSFWSVVEGVLEALEHNAIDLDVNVKKLCARINLQMRRTLEGSGTLAERLLKDALFFIAISDRCTPTIERLQRCFGLENSVPRDYRVSRYGLADAITLKRAKEALNLAKTSWDKLVNGRMTEAVLFERAVQNLLDTTQGLEQPTLLDLIKTLGLVGKHASSLDTPPNPELGLETAMAILFVENTLEFLHRLNENFPARANLVRERLNKVLSGQSPDDSDEWLNQLAQKTHERQTMISLVSEIQTDLRSVEQILDGFFRKPSHRDDLDSLDGLLTQTSGALKLLGHDAAVASLDLVRHVIQGFLDTNVEPKPRDFERVAQTLAALSFYIDALRQPDNTVRPTLEYNDKDEAYTISQLEASNDASPFGQGMTRPIGQDTVPYPVQVTPSIETKTDISNIPATESLTDSVADPVSVEREIRQHVERAECLLDALSQSQQNPLALAELKHEVNEIRVAADLLDDANLVSTARQALRLLDGECTKDVIQDLSAALVALKGSESPAKESIAPSEATLALASSDDAMIDAELLTIFLEEAREVFRSIDEALAASQADPASVPHLTTLRRAFHTLKGSSRMVGLRQFGEAAWAMEQLFNFWLAEERVGNEPLYQLTLSARQRMEDWIDQIGAGDLHAVQPTDLISAAERVKQGEVFFFNESSVTLEKKPDEPDSPTNPAETADEADAVNASDTRQIGELTLSRQLFEIFLGEAESCLRTMQQALAEWRSNPTSGPSEQLIRAVHSLSGSSATTGLNPVHDIAAFLEQQLIVLEQEPIEVKSEEFNKLDTCVERLQGLLHQFAAGIFPLIDREAMSLIDDLRVAWLMRKTITPELSMVRATTPTMLTSPSHEVETRASPVEHAQEKNASEDDAEDDVSVVQDEIDAELVALFTAEANDLLPQIDSALRTLVREPNNEQQFGILLRALHTLKGSARMAGALRLGALLHNMETRAETAQYAPSSVLFEELQNRYDRAVGLYDNILKPQAAPKVNHGEASYQAHSTAVASATPPTVTEAVDISARALAMGKAYGHAPEKDRLTSALVRVRAEILDRLLNQAGEVSIARSRLENDLQTVRGSVGDLTENISRLRTHLREIEIAAETQLQSRLEAQKETGREFDPLEFDRFTRLQELTRMMAESVSDVTMLQQNIVRGLEGTSKNLLNQGRLTRDLQQDLMRVRMTPFDSLADRLYRVVRQTAKETGKRVNLNIEGGNVELDRSVLERMAGAFEHLLRNAVVHGIETPQERLKRGKSDTGNILLSVKQQGNEIRLEFADDGSGLNFDRIREQAVNKGLMSLDNPINDAQAAELIFTPGFSTASEITELAGRGVGMDVVRAETTALGGRISIDSHQGGGTLFAIQLPLTLAVTQVVLIRAGARVFALPSVIVEQVQHLLGSQLANAYNDGVVTLLGEKIDFAYLPLLLGDTTTYPTVQRYSPVIAIRSSHQRLVIHVDEVLGNREVVVKNIGPQLARMIGISGATVLGTGDIVLIIDPTQLYGRVDISRHLPAPLTQTGAVGEMLEDAVPAQTSTPAIVAMPVVMVVDDSITVRRVTQRLLVREGYQVVLAKDGVHALEQMQDVIPDVMLVDIEMPRMDGFDLTRNVRSDGRFKDIPIVMITSRTADKHREYAKNLGVNHYLGKPYNDIELLNIVKNLTQTYRSTGVSV